MTTYSKIILTKSGAQQSAPTAGDLDLGELAINYNDGKLFFKDGIDSIRVIGSSGSIISAAAHQDSKSNPHEVTKAQVGLSNVDNTADSAKEVSGPQISALNLKANQITTYNKIEVDSLILAATDDNIELTDLSMTPVAAASGTGGITYNNLTGEFTYIPPELSELGGLLASDISVEYATAAGTGDLTYDNNGSFTFKKPTLSGLGGIGFSNLSVSDISDEDDGSLTYDNSTGVFTYQSPSLVGLGGIGFSDLSVGAEVTPTADGSLTYDNATGQFIYDQPTLEGLGGNDKQDVNLNTVVVVALNYPVTSDNRVIFVDDDAAAGAVTLSLPPVGSVGDGFVLDIKKIGSTGNVTITANGAETIDYNTGVQSIEITDKNQSVRLISLTGGWKILSPHRITGWANYYDSASATIGGSPITVAAATTLQFQIDGLGAESISDYLPEGVITLWDTTINDNKIIPAKLGDAYDIRITFKADPVSQTAGLAEIVLDIGTTPAPNPIVTRTVGFPTGGLSAFTVGFPIGVTQEFLDNGGRIYFNNIGTGAIDISDISLFIKRDFSPI